MHIVFRVDADSKIGSGHIARCSVLANELSNRAHTVSLITNCQDERLINKFEMLNASSIYWTDNINANLRELLLESTTIDILVVDHYGLSRDWESKQREFVGKIIVIDDLANRSHDCDFLVDQNFYRDAGSRYKSLVSKDCQQFCGPKFTLLRPEYRRKRYEDQKAVNPTRTDSALVFLGASDLAGLSAKMTHALKDEFPNLKIELLVGSLNPKRSELRSEFAGERRVQTLEFQENLAPILRRNSFGVFSCGSIMWEAFACGLPTAVVTMTEEQKPLATGLAEAGHLAYLGHADEPQIFNRLWEFVTDADGQKKLNDSVYKLIDGRGALRIADVIAK